jgi:hypothetical protein
VAAGLQALGRSKVLVAHRCRDICAALTATAMKIVRASA